MQAGKHRISGQVAGAVLVFMGCIFMFAALQRQLIYFPETAAEGALLDAAEHSGLQAWRDRDGQLIRLQFKARGFFPALASRCDACRVVSFVTWT